MVMAISLNLRRNNNNSLISRLNHLFNLQRLKHDFSNGQVFPFPSPIYPKTDFHSMGRRDEPNSNVVISKWVKVDGRVFGINRSMIPSPSWTVLNILHKKGFEAYLVGGCVRDLLLNRVPKDFDVITTAGLKQIRNQFHRAYIVGRRFPICVVNIKDSVIEVTSFETIAKHVKEEVVTVSKVPEGCDKKDLIRWRNSLHRDFTINSLFFDPFLNIIYDYAEGIADLRSLKLRTLGPALLSFKEDCARILRGLRIAARLGLSFSKDTETAMLKLSPSIRSLDKSRLMMELNYMLSYGAAVPSLHLLQRFNLLKILLPFNAAYLDLMSIEKSPLNPMMLMELFFNLDKLVSCDRPSDSNIWVGLLAFHMALVNHPQNSLIVLAFASTLYQGEWNKGVNFARENSQVQTKFVPEITTSAPFKSDEELAKGVAHFASIVQDSVAAFTDTDCLLEAMSTFPTFPCSGLVFVPKKTAKDVANIFEVLVNDIESYRIRRDNFEIDYRLLRKGNLSESRHVLGKVILETLKAAIIRGGRDVLDEKRNLSVGDTVEEDCNFALSDLVHNELVIKKDRKARKASCSSEVMLGANKNVQKEGGLSETMVESRKRINVAEKHYSVVLQPVELNVMKETKKCHLSKVGETESKQDAPETKKKQDKEMIRLQEAHDEVSKNLLQTKVNMRKRDEVIGQDRKLEKKSKEKHRNAASNEVCIRPLSSLFK